MSYPIHPETVWVTEDGAGCAMTADIITPTLLEWVERVKPGARVVSCTVHPLSGEAAARRVEQMTLHLVGNQVGQLELVRKGASAHEIAGLCAAQAVLAETTAIPELVDSGTNWLITPLIPGSSLTPDDELPANLFDTLARLHSRYHGGADLPDVIPRVSPAWWHALCREWVDPRLREHAARHPPGTTARARALIDHVADHPAAAAVLADVTPRRLNGDVRPAT